MKKETLEKGLDILRQIDSLEYQVKDFERTKKEYSEKGYIRIDSGSFDKIQIPFKVFEKWFIDEISVRLIKITELNEKLKLLA